MKLKIEFFQRIRAGFWVESRVRSAALKETGIYKFDFGWFEVLLLIVTNKKALDPKIEGFRVLSLVTD